MKSEMKKVVWLVGLMALMFSPGLHSATLSGKVNYKGTAPKKELIKMPTDPYCAKLAQTNPAQKEEVIVNPNGTLANVFVFVKEGVKGSVPPAPTTPVTFDQKGCVYHPHVIGIRVGQPLKILNSDSTTHNVNIQAKANPKANLAMAMKGQAIERKFTKPEQMIKTRCDIHGWMNAYIGVMAHPYFAITGTDGNFEIKDLPPGEYTLEAWHEKLGTKTEKITVTATKATPVEFTFVTDTST